MKLGIVLLAVFLVFSIAPMASASTMEVDVHPGHEFDLETELTHDNSKLRIVGKFGLNENNLIDLSYTMDSETICIGGRYELKRGTALFYDYSTGDEANMLNFGIRDISNLVDNLNMIGELKYTNLHLKDPATNQTSTTSTWAYTLQFQERVSRTWSGNIDFTYSYSKGDSDFSGAIGADFYLKRAKLYFNYQIEDDHDENIFLAGVAFNF